MRCHSDDRREEESQTIGVVSRDSSRSTTGLASEWHYSGTEKRP